jgi:hypothetical protein
MESTWGQREKGVGEACRLGQEEAVAHLDSDDLKKGKDK